jgi:hypothetical protein
MLGSLAPETASVLIGVVGQIRNKPRQDVLRITYTSLADAELLRREYD